MLARATTCPAGNRRQPSRHAAAAAAPALSGASTAPTPRAGQLEEHPPPWALGPCLWPPRVGPSWLPTCLSDTTALPLSGSSKRSSTRLNTPSSQLLRSKARRTSGGGHTSKGWRMSGGEHERHAPLLREVRSRQEAARALAAWPGQAPSPHSLPPPRSSAAPPCSNAAHHLLPLQCSSAAPEPPVQHDARVLLHLPVHALHAAAIHGEAPALRDHGRCGRAGDQARCIWGSWCADRQLPALRLKAADPPSCMLPGPPMPPHAPESRSPAAAPPQRGSGCRPSCEAPQ